MGRRIKDFKRFMSFVGKEFNHILRDTRTLMVLLVMPVVMIVLFGFALSTEIKDVKVVVLDPSNDAATTRIINQIDASEYFTVTSSANSEEGILQAFQNNTADIALVFEDNFYHRAVHDGDGSIQVIVDGSNTNVGSMAVFYVSSIVSSFGIHERDGRRRIGSRADSYFHEDDVQSADEKRVQLRARSYGYDTYADMRHDDIRVHCP